ncbi:MAG TPA: multidrug effflux MFS transporter [Kofleriaceae bacterium]|nr:multidrug effflux MFS transporter [Kofleriaceae bacterium]
MKTAGSGARFSTPVGSGRWIVTLAALTAVVALSIDMSLPAQPTLARTFGVSSETAQLTLSLFLIGFAAMQIFVGYLSDAWGRRRVLLGGLAAFTVAGIACAVSPSIEVLLACRVLQGAGAAAAPVVARAMVRDTQPAGQAARLLSTMLSALAVAPMVAPVIGGALLGALGWRSIFVALALTGIVMYALAQLTLDETLSIERRRTLSLRGLFTSYRVFFTTSGTRLPMLVGCTTFAGQFAYIADSPFVLMGGYGVSADHFGFYFGATALALMLGSIVGSRLLRAGRSPGVLTVIGTAVLLVGGILVVAGTRAELGIAGFMVPMLIYFFGAGLGSPSATALAMQPVPHIAGTASAAIGCLTMVAGSISGYETTRIGGSSPSTFALVVLVMAVLAFGLAIAAALRRRTYTIDVTL